MPNRRNDCPYTLKTCPLEHPCMVGEPCAFQDEVDRAKRVMDRKIDPRIPTDDNFLYGKKG